VIIYNEKQKEAIIDAFRFHFEIITGGPGTGKTTIIKSIVKLYQELYKKSKSEMIEEVSLLAPTGRAAKRMTETVGLKASTIHRFLKWNKETNKFKVNEHNKVDTKLVIIDEASMIDTYLLDSLLKGLYYDTKIILVGDYNQLPSVGSGQILKDLIESNMFNVVELSELYRQKENSNIITFADDINRGIYNLSLFNKEDDLTYISCDSYNLIDKFSELCYSYQDYDPNELIILAPMYKTINGIDNLNLIAREIFNPKSDDKEEMMIGDIKYRELDKVILLINMPDDDVYNGDIGIICEIDKFNNEIYIDFDGNIVKFNKSKFTNFKLGYVTSIHKSQGSEFKVVIMILLNEFNRMLYRKLLYTGVTRAKKNLYLLGEETAIKRCINNNIINDRKTSLLEIVRKKYE
jgi:exodeoxyribonuclease V alpha subunit